MIGRLLKRLRPSRPLPDASIRDEARAFLEGEGETVEAMGEVVRDRDAWGEEQITVHCRLADGGKYGQSQVTLPANYFGAPYEVKTKIANDLRID